MIAALTGRILSLFHDRAVVDVSGVGYEVFMTSDGIARLPERDSEVFLHIHTQVREDAITLFGFLEEEEKEMFLILKSVSGIGPKVALSALSGMRAIELSQAIGEGDVKRLTTLPGIGKKTAERICVELKDKVSQIGGVTGGASLSPPTPLGQSSGGSVIADAISALTNLGYPDPVARQALAKLKEQLGEEPFSSMSVEELLREALRSLA